MLVTGNEKLDLMLQKSQYMVSVRIKISVEVVFT